MIVAILIVLATIAAKVGYDYRLWLKKKPVNHAKEWVLMGLASAYPIIKFTYASSLAWYLAAPLSSLMAACFIWFFFDGVYNIARGYQWFFTGSNDNDDAVMDDFIQKLKPWQHKAVKFAGLIIPIVIYILTK